MSRNCHRPTKIWYPILSVRMHFQKLTRYGVLWTVSSRRSIEGPTNPGYHRNPGRHIGTTTTKTTAFSKPVRPSVGDGPIRGVPVSSRSQRVDLPPAFHRILDLTRSAHFTAHGQTSFQRLRTLNPCQPSALIKSLALCAISVRVRKHSGQGGRG